MHDDRQHHAAQAEYGANGQIDAASDNDQRHAQRDNCDERDVAGDVVDVLGRCKGICRHRQEDAGENDGDQDPECLAAQDRRKPAPLLLPDRLVKCNRHRRPSSFSLRRIASVTPVRWRR